MSAWEIQVVGGLIVRGSVTSDKAIATARTSGRPDQTSLAASGSSFRSSTRFGAPRRA